jgi:esterase/lipase/1-acyl-sn-glycerol-3-phosphate acyltransferase
MTGRLNMSWYRATGVVLTAMRRLFKVELRVTGAEHLPDRPTLYAVNHFTRLETLLIPYVIYLNASRTVRILAKDALFKGFIGSYFNRVGVMSTRSPWRDRTIVRDLLTGRQDWVIFPEGGLIKNKKTVRRGRLRLDRPDRAGPPHTGAAVLVLKAEVARRRVQEAARRGDPVRLAHFRSLYGLSGPGDLCPHSPVLVPVTITFYPLRPAPNLVNRLARFLNRDLHPAVDEELQVEGQIILGHCQVGVHFGTPLEPEEYLTRAGDLGRRMLGLVSETHAAASFLRRQSARLTRDCMRSVYNNLEINFDHLFCYGLRTLRDARVRQEDLHRALHLAICELRAAGGVRLHATLAGGTGPLELGGAAFEPLVSIRALAEAQGVLRREGADYVIDRAALGRPQEFNQVRLKNTVLVLANELEPVAEAVDVVRRAVNLSPEQVRRRLSSALQEIEVRTFVEEMPAPNGNGDATALAAPGAPYLLRPPRRAHTGVVLVHGYLSSPQQMRPLGEDLRRRGAAVYAVRLEGHGTSPRRLAGATWPEWVESVQEGCAILAPHCRRLVLVGFSLGAVIALLVAERQGAAIDGVVAINAPMVLRDRRAVLVPALAGWNEALRRMGLAGGRAEYQNNSESPDINYATYDLDSLRQLRRAVRECRRHLGHVEVPVLVVHAEADPIVSPRSRAILSRRLSARRTEVCSLPMDRHLVVRGPGSEVLFDRIWDFVHRGAEDSGR